MTHGETYAPAAPGGSTTLFELFQQCSDRFCLWLSQSTEHGHEVRGLDNDNDPNFGVKHGHAFGAVATLETAVKGSIRIGVY